MKRRRLLTTVAIAMLLIAGVAAAASTVRGKLYREGSGGSYAASGIMLRLLDAKGGVRTTYSASDGMFYFYNVAPGAYTLEIRATDGDLRTYNVHVATEPYTDLAPIPVP